MRAAEVQWDLSGMGWDELLSEATILFLGKVLAAASLVAFGPALVLEYVPTSKVDVRDITSASSTEGRTQRLLLAFAGGGLMAEAALHLLPHLFMPHHDDDHGHGDGHKPLGDACTLIAVGFLAAFAIDRFVGVRQQQQQQKKHQPEQKVELEKMDPAAVTTAGTHAAAALEVLRGGGDVAAAEEIAVTAGVAGAADATESTEAATAAGVAALTQEEGEEEETQETGQQAEEESLPEAAVPAAPASEHDGDSQGGGGGDEGAVEGDDGPREFVSSSSATDVDEGSAAGAMLASAHMTQTPEKRPPATPGDAASSEGDDALKVAPEDTVPEGGTPQPSPEVPPAAAPFSAVAAAPSSEPAGGAASAGTVPPPPPPPPPAGSPELTRYGNPREGAVNAAVGSEQEGLSDGHCAAAVASTDAVVADAKGVAVAGGDGGDMVCSKVDNHHHHHHDHHDDHHGPADAGAYVTLAVDFLHNVIDGIGIGAAYAVGGDVIGHTTAALKLVHEVQHEIGDVATLVQCGMSKHHAIHIQHTTAAGVFLGVAISLGAGAFPEGLLASCLALSAGATFHLASGTVLGPVLAIPADVGGPVQGLLEVAALAAGAAGVVAVGLAEGWAGIGH